MMAIRKKTENYYRGSLLGNVISDLHEEIKLL
jgi:hypothetical protein